MAQLNNKELTTLPVGRLGLIPLESCRPLGEKVNEWLVKWRNERDHAEMQSFAFEGYQRDSYIVDVKTPRFGSGEGKGEVNESVRGDDIYLMVDVTNYSLTYRISGFTNLMSPDDHFQDLKRVIAAIGGKARRVNVIMPYLYESRQSKRTGRESLDCAMALEELTAMGVSNILTFDAHDPRVQNAIPIHGFDNFYTSYQFIREIFERNPEMPVDADHLMIVSPDEGGMRRAVYYASLLGIEMGMFYRRRDYSYMVNGEHPVVSVEFLGNDVEGKDVIIVDDMISSGYSILEIASLLKKRGAGRIYICTTFGFFTDGLEKFDDAARNGIFDKLLTTNLIYQTPELLAKPYYISCDMSKYIALIIDTLNHDMSVSHLLNPADRIKRCVSNYMAQYDEK